MQGVIYRRRFRKRPLENHDWLQAWSCWAHGTIGREVWHITQQNISLEDVTNDLDPYLEKIGQNFANNLMIDEDDMQSFNHLPVIKHSNWKFRINEGFYGKLINRWWVFNCHVWLPDITRGAAPSIVKVASPSPVESVEPAPNRLYSRCLFL